MTIRTACFCVFLLCFTLFCPSTMLFAAPPEPLHGVAWDFSHGPIKVSDDARSLIHADGTPFLWLGDTAWELFHRLTRDEVEFYLEKRRSQGFTVIQAVALAEFEGLTRPTPAGHLPLIGHTGEVCGFVSAACLLLGLKHGTDAPDAKLKVNPLCLELCDTFAAKYGSVNCKDIIKRDIRTMEATVKAKGEGVFKDICFPCGQFVAKLLETKYDILNGQP